MGNKFVLYVNGNSILYTVVKTKRSSIGITVDNNGNVRVSAPKGIVDEQIMKLVQKKSSWIEKKVMEAVKRNSDIISRKFMSGEILYYIGREYVLDVVKTDLNRPSVEIHNNTIKLHVPQGLLNGDNEKEVIKQILIAWYRQCFAEIIHERILFYSLKLKVSPSKVVIKNQKTRWGSCSTKGNINLNWRLVMAPIEIIDYVIVHELCHLKIMNHSKDYWNLVKTILPDYTVSRKWLKDKGYILTV